MPLRYMINEARNTRCITQQNNSREATRKEGRLKKEEGGEKKEILLGNVKGTE